MTLQGNTILVAGGAHGIGRGLAELLCRMGNDVLVFGAPPAAGSASARRAGGPRSLALDLADTWGVASFAEQVGLNHPRLNMFLNISIAFPVRYLPGMQALLDGDDTLRALEAHRLGVQHLTGALLAHLRKQPHSSVVNVCAGPVLAPLTAPSMAVAADGAAQASVMSVRKRWAAASVEVIDVSRPSRAERVAAERPTAPGMPLATFVSGVANLLADGLHEEATLKRLQALWPSARPVSHESQDDNRVSEAA